MKLYTTLPTTDHPERLPDHALGLIAILSLLVSGLFHF
jgi:hypothetical protein